MTILISNLCFFLDQYGYWSYNENDKTLKNKDRGFNFQNKWVKTLNWIIPKENENGEIEDASSGRKVVVDEKGYVKLVSSKSSQKQIWTRSKSNEDGHFSLKSETSEKGESVQKQHRNKIKTI